MRTCPACGRPTDTLGAYFVAIDPDTELEGCITCILASAVPVRDLIRISTSPRWESIPIGFKRQVTVYDCGSYISLLAWANLQRQQVAAVEPDEDDKILAQIMEHMAEADPKPELPPEPTQDRDWISRAVSWFFPFAWRTADA